MESTTYNHVSGIWLYIFEYEICHSCSYNMTIYWKGCINFDIIVMTFDQHQLQYGCCLHTIIVFVWAD